MTGTDTLFANAVLGDWDAAMSRFFEAVDRKRLAEGLADTEVREALDIGYGTEVADAWTEWVTS